VTFPETDRNALIELKVGSSDWANITGDVYTRDAIEITRGKTDEAGQVPPSICRLTLDNTAGRYSPRNPLSPLYGQIGRNTPLRVSIGQGAYGMVLGQVGGTESTGRAETFDSAALSITGDLDVRVDMEILTDSTRLWTTGNFDIISKFRNIDTDRSWSLIVVAGKLRLYWFSLGTVASVRMAESSVALPSPTKGRRAVRFTLDVNNGAAGADVRFYTSDTIDGTWTQLGTTQTSAGTTSIFDGAAWVRAGANPDVSTYSWGVTAAATIRKAEIRNGIGGTVVASPDFTTQPLDPVPFALSSFTDAQGNSWSFSGGADQARIWYGNVDVRFVGEIASLPPRWGDTGTDPYVQIEAAGLLRRLQLGKAPAENGLRQWVLSQMTTLTSYFPLEGAEGTKYSINLGRVGPNIRTFYPEQPFGVIPQYTYGKEMPGVWLGNSMELNATGDTSWMRGDVAAGDDNFSIDFVWQSAAMGRLTIEVQDYNVNRWLVDFQDATDTATVWVRFVDNTSGSTFGFSTVGPFPELQDLEVHTGRFEVRTSGSDMTFAVYIDGVSVKTGTMPGFTWFGTALYRLYYSRFTGQTVTNLAHLTLWSHPTPAGIPTAAEFTQAAFGYAGEAAGDRMERIASVSAIPLVIIGDPADTMLMGPQYSESQLSQLRDAEEADLGILAETRDEIGLLYRTRKSMYNQDSAFSLSMEDGQVSAPFEPVDDDTYTRNDVTVTRREGGSFRVTKETGALSSADPPEGVGLYRDEVTVNVQTDGMLAGVASWLMNQGTLDEARFPSITVDLAKRSIVDLGLEFQILAADIGDRVNLFETAAFNIYNSPTLIILGYAERIMPREHTIRFYCMPGTLFQIDEYGSARYDTPGAELASSATSTTTSLSVSASGGMLWTTDPASFPFFAEIGGEQVSVTNITGASSPQTFTVARSQNGVVKAQSAGTPVRLWKPSRYAL
jgi:hypothetical protein